MDVRHQFSVMSDLPVAVHYLCALQRVSQSLSVLTKAANKSVVVVVVVVPAVSGGSV